MRLNLLLTPEVRATMPKTVKIIQDFGHTHVVFPDENNNIEHSLIGNNAVLEASEADIIAWLKPFDGIAVGTGGSPQMEKFTIMHIK